MEKIKKVIVVIIAGILLTTTIFPIVSGDGDILDQYQTEFKGWSWDIKSNSEGAQSFQPNLSTLTKVDLLIWKEAVLLGDYIVRIHEFLDAAPIAEARVTAITVPTSPGWVEFIFKEVIEVEPQQTYYITSSSDEAFGTYYWGGAYETVYDRGTQWRKTSDGPWVEYPDYDFCFKTYGLEENNPPIAYDDFYSVDEGQLLVVDAVSGVLANDIDPDGDSITASLVSAPIHDSSFALSPNGSFNYTHDGSESTSDSFTYRAYDGMAYSNVATVWITINPVNDPPVANADSYSVDEDNSLNVVAPGVLSNDYDPENDPLSTVLIEDVSHGSLNLNSDGSFDYDPDTNFNGVDVFIYQAYDGTDYSENASVTITVEPINDFPVANNDYPVVDEDSSDNLIDVLANDYDPDGHGLTITDIDFPPSHGIASTDGDFCYYTPDPDYCGSDRFDYLISDGNGGWANGSVHIDVTCFNDPPVANDDYPIVDEDSSDNLIDVLANDSDPDVGDDLEIIDVSDPSTGSAWTDGDYIYYTPNENYCGLDEFNYTISDLIGETCNATVFITITCVNDVPIAFIDSISPNPAKYSTLVSFSGHGTDVEGDILAYDWDSSIDGQLSDQASFSTSSLSIGEHIIYFKVQDEEGEWSEADTDTLTILENQPPIAYIDSISPNPAEEGTLVTFTGHGDDPDGSVSGYEWESNISGILSTDATFTNSTLPVGTHNITFKVQDDDGVWSDIVNETLIIEPIPPNYPPIANPDYVTVYNNTKDNKIDVLANDSDPDDGDIINLTIIVTQPQNGTARIENNIIRYTPDPGFYGVNTLEYNITDSQGANATGLVTVTVKNASKLSIDEPQSGYVYFNGNPKFALKFLLAFLDIDVLAIGSITFEANITETEGSGEAGKVEFYVDDELKATDTDDPYNWTWNEFAIGIYTVQIVVYDTEDNIMTEDSIDVLIINLRGELG